MKLSDSGVSGMQRLPLAALEPPTPAPNPHFSTQNPNSRALSLKKLRKQIVFQLTHALASASHHLALIASGQASFNDDAHCKAILALVKLLPHLLPPHTERRPDKRPWPRRQRTANQIAAMEELVRIRKNRSQELNS